MQLLPLDDSADHPANSAKPVVRSADVRAEGQPGRQADAALQPATGAQIASTPKAGAETSTRAPAAVEPATASGPAFSDYQRRLYDTLALNSRYPAEARREHLSGVTQLAFRLDRSGTVLESWIQKSAGSEVLDNAAFEALARAQPLPPIPANLPARLDFVVEMDLSVLQAANQTPG